MHFGESAVRHLQNLNIPCRQAVFLLHFRNGTKQGKNQSYRAKTEIRELT